MGACVCKNLGITSICSKWGGVFVWCHVQYIGFSKDVRNSLRTLMGRRPELCYYFKVFNLDKLDQTQMLAARQQVRL